MKDNEVKIEIIQPWSNIIYRINMPESITQGLIDYTDKLRDNPDTPSYGESLVAQVEEELEVNVSKIAPVTANFILNCSREWLYNQL